MNKFSHTPLYLEIYQKVKNNIIEGLYGYGEKLPSKRSAAERYGVSVITVEHAYILLEQEGYIRCSERRGYFVIYRAEQTFICADIAEAIPFKPSEPLKIENQFPVSVYAKAVRKALSEHSDKILERTENFGLPDLREAIARYLGRVRGISVTSEQIIVGSGAESLYHTAVLLLGANSSYAIESPSYEKIEQSYNAYGISCQKLSLCAEGIAAEQLKACSANVLHVTPYHSFPSGVTASAAKKREYLLWARLNNSIIIEDDFGSEFCANRKPIDTLFSMDNGERVIYINTFSKTISPAVRIGYMLLPKGMLKRVKKTVGFLSCSVPVLEQYALAEILNNGSFERHLNRCIAKRRKNGEN